MTLRSFFSGLWRGLDGLRHRPEKNERTVIVSPQIFSSIRAALPERSRR